MDKGFKKKLLTMLCVLSVFLSIPLSVCSLTYEEIYGELNTLGYQIDNETLSAFSNVHPKLLLNTERLSEIQNALADEDAMMQKAYSELLKRARWGLDSNPPETITTASYDTFFSYLYEYAPSLALSYVLTREEKYLEGAKKWILAACDYPVWETKPDLATGIALTSLGLSYDWLYEYLDDAERVKVKSKMLEQANVVYENMRGAKTGFNRYWLQNHMWIPVSGMACAAAALYGEEEIAADFLTLANNHFSTTMSLLPEDGFAHEGMDYFFYGMESLFIYSDLSCELLGVDLFETDFLRNVSDYMLYQFYPKSAWNTDCYYSNIGDSAGKGLKTHMIRLAAAKNRDGYAQWLANELDANDVASGHPYLKMLWYDRSLLPTDPQEGKSLLKHFTDMDVAVSKTGWGENESMLIFKSGLPMGHKENELSKTMTDFYDFGGAHVHPDNNHFILYGNGELLLRDDNYSVPKFTSQHNTLTVNGEGQLGDSDRWFDTLEFHDGNGFAQIKKAETVSGIDHIVGDAADSYRASAGLTKFDRHLIFIKPDILLVVDDIQLKSDQELKLRFWPNGQEISETEDGFLVMGSQTKLKISDLTNNSDTKASETETVWKQEVTEERKSVSFSKNASQWVSAKAISWSDLSEEPASVPFEADGRNLLFRNGKQLLTLNLDTESLTVSEQCEINFSVSGNGSVLSAPEEVSKGQMLSCTIVPDSGWYIESVKINGVSMPIDNRTSYQLNSIITQDSTIEVCFEKVEVLSDVKFKLYNESTKTAGYIDVLANGGEIINGFTAPVYKTGEGAITDPSLKDYYNTTNMVSWFQMFADTGSSKYNYFYNIPEYLKDSTYLRLKKVWREPQYGADTPNAMNAQSEVLTFDIGATVNVYYVFPNAWVSNVPELAKWLNEEGWTLCAGEKVQFVESYNEEGKDPQIKESNLIFRKKFVVTPGEKQTVKIGGFKENYFVPMVFLDWVDENTTKNVSVSVIGSGTVDKIGNWDVAKGDTFTIKATPADGCKIESIKFNGTEVPVGNTYTTPAIHADAVIEVTFKEVTPKQPSIAHTYTEKFTSSTPQTINGKEISGPMSIVFAKVQDYTGYTLVDFGMEFAADKTALEAGNGKKCSATAGKSDLGNYGICFYGNFEQGKTYYTRPYAVYGKEGETPLTVTGETILEIVPNP